MAILIACRSQIEGRRSSAHCLQTSSSTPKPTRGFTDYCTCQNLSTKMPLQSDISRPGHQNLPSKTYIAKRLPWLLLFYNCGEKMCFHKRENMDRQFCSLLWESLLIGGKKNGSFPSVHHSSLFTHLSQHLNFLQELGLCLTPCYG